MNVLTGS